MPHRLIQLLSQYPADASAWNTLETEVRRGLYTRTPLDLLIRWADSVAPDDFCRLALTSFSANGYERQAALKQLARLDPQQVAPFFIRRLHDWVSPIAEQADAWVSSEPEACFDWLPLVGAELEKRRPTGSGWWTVLSAELCESPELTEDAPRLVRHLLPLGPSAEAIEVWLGFPDVSARLGVARHVLEREELRDLRPRLRSDPHPAIRALDVDWRDALWDPSARVREAAIYWCRQAGEKPADLYRKKGDERALAGLSQCAEAQDLPTFAGRLEAPHGWQRHQALETMSRLDVRGAEERARELLRQDASSRVRRLALKLLGASLPVSELLLLCVDGSPGLRRDAQRMLARLHPWQHLLQILQQRDAAALPLWVQRFRRRSSLRPSPDIAPSLRAEFGAAEWLPDYARVELAFLR